MRELLLGIIDFRRRLRPALLRTFQKMATSQKPNSLFIACADSRVVPNLFASTNPGELFSIRNVGNLIPPPDQHDESELAAVEFSVDVLGVRNIILCGHSECGAMKAILQKQTEKPIEPEPLKAVVSTTPHLNSWLRHGVPSFSKYHMMKSAPATPATFFNGYSPVPAYIEPSLPPQDQLSQVNVLQQVEHICSYKKVQEKVQKGEILIHAWCFSDRKGKFVLIDDAKAVEILERLGEHVTLQEIAAKYDVSRFRNPSWTEQYLSKSGHETESAHAHSADGSCCSHHNNITANK